MFLNQPGAFNGGRWGCDKKEMETENPETQEYSSMTGGKPLWSKTEKLSNTKT